MVGTLLHELLHRDKRSQHGHFSITTLRDLVLLSKSFPRLWAGYVTTRVAVLSESGPDAPPGNHYYFAEDASGPLRSCHVVPFQLPPKIRHISYQVRNTHFAVWLAQRLLRWAAHRSRSRMSSKPSCEQYYSRHAPLPDPPVEFAQRVCEPRSI